MPQGPVWREVSTMSHEGCRWWLSLSSIPAQACTVSVQMTEGGQQFIFLSLPLPIFSCYNTSKPWEEPISQLHKPSPAVRHAPESPSEASVKSQHPTCTLPHHCQLVRHLHRRGIFGVLRASPHSIHSRVCPRSLLHSFTCFINTLDLLGHNQRLFMAIWRHYSHHLPQLAHTPLSHCNCIEIIP